MDWLSAALIAIIVPMALGVLSKAGRVPAEFRDGKTWLEYGRTFKIFSCVGIMIPCGFGIVLFYVEPKEVFALSMVILLFAVLTVPLFLEAFFVKIGFDESVVYCYSPWRPNRQIKFSDLGEPCYSNSLQWWVIPSQNSGYIRLQDFISGKEDLLNKVREQLPSDPV